MPLHSAAAEKPGFHGSRRVLNTIKKGTIVDPDLMLILPAAVLTVVSLGTISLVGWRMWLRRPPVPDSASLTEKQREFVRKAVREEVAELLASRDRELDDLFERIDFAERMLIRARAPEETPEREMPPD